MALLPRKRQCCCLTCLGPTDPHRSVSVAVHTVAQRKGVEAHGLCSHSPISHTRLSYTLTTTLMEVTQASPTAPFYKASWVQRSSVFFQRQRCSSSPFITLLSFLREPPSMPGDRWSLSGKTEGEVKPQQQLHDSSSLTFLAAVWNHPQRKNKKNDHASSMQL